MATARFHFYRIVAINRANAHDEQYEGYTFLAHNKREAERHGRDICKCFYPEYAPQFAEKLSLEQGRTTIKERWHPVGNPYTGA